MLRKRLVLPVPTFRSHELAAAHHKSYFLVCNKRIHWLGMTTVGPKFGLKREKFLYGPWEYKGQSPLRGWW